MEFPKGTNYILIHSQDYGRIKAITSSKEAVEETQPYATNPGSASYAGFAYTPVGGVYKWRGEYWGGWVFIRKTKEWRIGCRKMSGRPYTQRFSVSLVKGTRIRMASPEAEVVVEVVKEEYVGLTHIFTLSDGRRLAGKEIYNLLIEVLEQPQDFVDKQIDKAKRRPPEWVTRLAIQNPERYRKWYPEWVELIESADNSALYVYLNYGMPDC